MGFIILAALILLCAYGILDMLCRIHNALIDECDNDNNNDNNNPWE